MMASLPARSCLSIGTTNNYHQNSEGIVVQTPYWEFFLSIEDELVQTTHLSSSIMTI